MKIIKYDYRCWIIGKNNCDGKCDSNLVPQNQCGLSCRDCKCMSCNQAGDVE